MMKWDELSTHHLKRPVPHLQVLKNTPFMYFFNPTTSRLSLLLHKSEAKPRTSVNNNDNLRVQWDLSNFYPMLLMCMTMASVHRLPLFFEVIYNLL